MNIFSRKIGFSLTTLLPVLLLSTQGPIAQAQDSDPDIYGCKQCVKYTGWRGILDFGLAYVSEDSLRFGDYRGLEEEGFYAALDGDIHYRNLEGRYFDLYAQNLAYDSRELDIRGGNQGRYELRFGWQEIPKYHGYGTQTPFLGVGSEYLTLPDDWVRAPGTEDMTTLNSNLAIEPLKTERKIMDAGATLKFFRNWSFRADYQRQEKKGTRAFSAGLFNATIVPAPIDFTTDQFDIGLSWANRRAQIELGFIGSYFESGNNSLTWMNPFSSRAVNDLLQVALEPDNDFYQFSLSGAFVLTPRIRLSGQASTGQLTQDEPFLPYSTNPSFSDLPLPRTSLDGKLDTRVVNLSGKLSARLNSRLSLTLRARKNERDNKTPVDIYTPVRIDILPGDERYNRPYSYEREQYSTDLRFRAHRVIRLSGGARYEGIDRTYQAVRHSEETTWWGEAKVNPLASTQFRFKLESSDRDVEDYLQPDDGGAVDHPLMRKFNQADRDREKVLIELDLAPLADLGINLSYFEAKSDYDESVIGLQESNDESYTINLNYMVGGKVNLYAFLTRDDIDADLVNTTGGSAVPWNAKTRDEITTIGIGLSTRINEKSSIGFDYVSSDSTGNISVQTTAEEDPFSPLKTDLSNARLYFDHEINDRWGYKLYAEYENYDASDWAIDGLGVDGISSVLTMGEESPDYKAWYFRVQASYRF